MEEKVKKDVIYIDIDDDITDVVGKIKDSKEKIIALVPPKGIGILRSSVNLRLLAKTSKKFGKVIVLITNNPSLLTMAAASEIPVAKSLQSKPEVPEVDVLEVEGDDIIDGESLPVSAFAGKTQDEEEAEMLENLDIDDNKSFSKKEPEVARESRKKSAAPAIKVPNFNAFRKKLFIFGGLGVFAILFLFWAIFIAPAATVIISAKTSDLNISEKISLSSSAAEVDTGKNIIPVKTEVIEKVEEVKFDATGTKEVGDAASGVLKLRQSTESSGYSIKAGTTFSYGDCNFVTTEGAVVSGFTPSVSGGVISGSGTGSVKIRSTQIGEQCNLPDGVRLVSSISGLVANSDDVTGGSKKSIKVVSESDANSARQKVSESKNDQIKTELLSKFGEGFKIIDESYAIETGELEVSPAVGQETSDGKGSVKVKTKYRISAVSKKNFETYLSKLSDSKIKADSQQVFENGSKNFQLTSFNGNDSTIQISATAKVGPKINESEIKKQIKGKVFGEVQSKLESIEGVKNVDVKFSYFWVSKIPNDDKKITIKFTVE